MSLCYRRQRLCRDGQERKPHVQPSTLWPRVGRIGRIGKNPRGNQFVLTAQQGLGRICQKFLVYGVTLPLGLAQRPKRHRRMMAGGAFACVQPGGAFGLQIPNGSLNRVLNMPWCCWVNQSRVIGSSEPQMAKSPKKRCETRYAGHRLIAL